MFKRAKVVMLPTKDENPVNVPFLKMPEKQKLVKHLAGGQFRTYLQVGFKPQHLYFYIDEKPSISDWAINHNLDTIYQIKDEGDTSNWYKIIATTDKSLKVGTISQFVFDENSRQRINTDVYFPQPSQSFIEKFVEEYNKGNVISEVLVEYEDNGEEEWLGDDYTGEPFWNERIELKVNSKDNTITIKKVKDSWNREEMIETINKLLLDLGRNIPCFVDNSVLRIDTHSKNKWIEENL